MSNQTNFVINETFSHNKTGFKTAVGLTCKRKMFSVLGSLFEKLLDEK